MTWAQITGFLTRYASVAGAAALVNFVIYQAIQATLDGSFLRGALIGGTVAAMMWPVLSYARTCRKSDPEAQMGGGKAWAVALLFAALALAVHGVFLGIAIVTGALRDMGAIEQIMAYGLVALVIIFVLQVFAFRFFLWSAFRGLDQQTGRG